jgi:ADP-ribose pyrophosphatase
MWTFDLGGSGGGYFFDDESPTKMPQVSGPVRACGRRKDMPVDIQRSEPGFSGRVLKIRVDTIRLDDGREATLEILEHAGSVVMVPVDADGGIWFVRQYRHAAGREILELPAGSLDPGEDPEEAAGRELREEIGRRADRLTRLGAFYLAPGYATEYMTAFLAEDLHPDPLPGDVDEVLTLEKLAPGKAAEMLAGAEFEDAKTIAALSLALARI